MKRIIAASLLALSLAACQQQKAEEPAAAAPEAKPGLSASEGVLMLPAVIRYNARDLEVGELYRTLTAQAGLNGGSGETPAAVAALTRYVEDFRALAGLPASLTEAQVRDPDVSVLAQDAARQWTASFNPRPLAESDFAALYRTVL